MLEYWTFWKRKHLQPCDAPPTQEGRGSGIYSAKRHHMQYLPHLYTALSSENSDRPPQPLTWSKVWHIGCTYVACIHKYTSPVPYLHSQAYTRHVLDANDTALLCYSTSAHTGLSARMHLHVRPSVAAGCRCTVESKRWETAASSPEGSGTHLSLQCRIHAVARASVSWGREKQHEKTYRRN